LRRGRFFVNPETIDRRRRSIDLEGEAAAVIADELDPNPDYS